MTRDDIIRMAREAGLGTALCHNSIDGDRIWVEGADWHDEIERFAALVAAAEREAISDEYSSRLQGDLENGVQWLNEAASEEFQEKYPELAGFLQWLDVRDQCAAAIRAMN
jgi:hypothetical protein